MSTTIEPIAVIRTDFSTKFGIPRQSGLSDDLKGRIVFTEKYRNPDAVRGMEDFARIWLIWQFSENRRDTWSPTVRPPRLGGNERLGVFATRSPFRPNNLGLSCVKLERVEYETGEGPVLYVSGIDLMDGTPIFDIKPYIPYADAYPDAAGGFTDAVPWHDLVVEDPEQLLERLPEEKRSGAAAFLRMDPRPAYRRGSDRVYGVEFAGFDIRFRVSDQVLRVTEVRKL